MWTLVMSGSETFKFLLFLTRGGGDIYAGAASNNLYLPGYHANSNSNLGKIE